MCVPVALTLTGSVRMNERPQAVEARALPPTEEVEVWASHSRAVCH